MADLIVVKKVKESVPDSNIGSEVYDALDEKVKQILKAAETRAKANGRKTIKAQDL